MHKYVYIYRYRDEGRDLKDLKVYYAIMTSVRIGIGSMMMMMELDWLGFCFAFHFCMEVVITFNSSWVKFFIIVNAARILLL